MMLHINGEQGLLISPTKMQSVLFRVDSTLSSKVVLAMDPLQKNAREELQEYILGSIVMTFNDDYDDAYYVEQVAAEKGWGPFLYLVGMLHATNHGLSPHNEKVSDKAKAVWEEFGDYPRNVIRSRRLAIDYHMEDYLNRSYSIVSDSLKKQIREEMRQAVDTGRNALGRDTRKEKVIFDAGDSWLFNRVGRVYDPSLY